MGDNEHDLLHVLVIDDDEEIRDLLTRILLPGGHQVVSAGSAEEGLQLLPYYTFQVAILDHRLPGMEGLVLGEYLTRNNPHMKVALVTGETDPNLVKFGMERSIAVIPKPFEVPQILDLITQYEREAAERKQIETVSAVGEHDPPFADYLGALTEAFEMPNVPKRLEESLIQTVKRCLNDLRTVKRYDEKDRVVALVGLLMIDALGIKPPRTNSGRTLFEEYDALMHEYRLRPEFEKKEKS